MLRYALIEKEMGEKERGHCNLPRYYVI